MSRLKIPAKTKIGGVEISIGYRGDLWEKEEAHGMFQGDTNTITLDSRVPATMKGAVYLHELFEAANELFHLKMPHPTIQTLALAVHQALTQGEGKAVKK